MVPVYDLHLFFSNALVTGFVGLGPKTRLARTKPGTSYLLTYLPLSNSDPKLNLLNCDKCAGAL